MTRDEIIRMAREAGMERVVDVHKDGTRTIELPHPDLLKRFATLVAAAEREACAKVCEELDIKSEDGEWGDYLAGWSDGTDDCAAAIRARKEKQ